MSIMNYMLNTECWSDRQSPVSRLSGFLAQKSKNLHVCGCYVLFHVPKELRSGKFRPTSEMGIWVGLDPSVANGHLVVPIEWDHKEQAWTLQSVLVITATTVQAHDRIFPLRMKPGTTGSNGKKMTHL
jgi:hypothetical protein